MFHTVVPYAPMIGGVATLPDLLRLLAVPIFGWAAWQDYRTRRVPRYRQLFMPLVYLGVILFFWEGLLGIRGSWLSTRLFLVRVGVVGIFILMAYFFHRRELFGNVDKTAFIAIAVLFPSYPAYHLIGVVFPIINPPWWIFALTILANGALIGLLYPVVLTIRNLLYRDFSIKMFVGRPVRWTSIPEVHGRLLESSDGIEFQGLDLDALRMYLRWHRCTLLDLRERPTALRDPSTVPNDPGDPTDGRLDPSERLEPGRDMLPPDTGPFVDADEWSYEDPWAAEEFVNTVGPVYGTTPAVLRDGLEQLAVADRVWVQPGLPYLVPVFAGLVVGLTYGDLLLAVLAAAGLG